jgi:hypothetical protein
MKKNETFPNNNLIIESIDYKILNSIRLLN